MRRGLDREVQPPLRAPLIRHSALCAATLAAYLARDALRVGNSVLWVLGFAVVMNLVAALVAGSRARRTRTLSAAGNLAGWLALMFLTGGVASPFVAGLFFEIVLAFAGGPPAGVAWIAAGAAAGLWLQQAPLGFDGAYLLLGVHTGFLFAVGAVTGAAAVRARAARSTGENAAGLAHGLKNAVHSLRGFLRLLERGRAGGAGDAEALDGLRLAIDDVDHLVRATLGSPGPAPKSRSHADLARVVSDVRREFAASFPDLRVSFLPGDAPPHVAAPAPMLRVVLASVVRNAAEAMDGKGEVVVDTRRRNGRLQIRVRDQGRGVTQPDRLFEPGFTTKAKGHGLGLFTARRLLRAQGGDLTMTSPDGGGAIFGIEVPVRQPSLR